MKIGIVGLPNVGKSTIFNALTRSKKAATAAYAFCTIDPNVGVVTVPDKRLKTLTDIVHPEKVVPAVVEFVDIAGIVKGASEGEGLGNQFLSHIRECDAIAEVIRFFEDENVSHVGDGVNPMKDLETIQTELILADLQTIQKRLLKAKSDAKSGDKTKVAYAEILEKVFQTLDSGKLAHGSSLEEEEFEELHDLHLLTMKPFLYIANVGETQLSNFNEKTLHEKTGISENYDIIPICAKLEEETAGLSEEDATELLKEYGLAETGLNHLIRTAYATLGLETYFTAGPQEVRAWTIPKGTKAAQAAGKIHTDFEKGFIKTEVTGFDEYVQCGGEQTAKEKGLVRQEGRDYLVKDGDVMYFRYNV
ncbi:redox-regulated ATPase YchF [Candidatus Peregrinibacteria bacterium]|nr:redox-regulated ATPase YchF [Candidatus Peregrinibacteria bacterium]